jgi:hypothetical protein
MPLTKLSLAGNNLIIPVQGEFGHSDILAGDGKIANPFLQCIWLFDQLNLGPTSYGVLELTVYSFLILMLSITILLYLLSQTL